MSVLVHTCDPLLRIDLTSAVREAGHVAESLDTLADLDACLADCGAAVVIVDLADRAARDAIARLSRSEPGVGILALGSRAGADQALDARRLGAHGFLRKPFDVETLERALSTVTRTGRPPRDGYFIADDPTAREFLDTLERAATSNATVLLRGESGAGKTRSAEWLHRASNRCHAPLVSITCSDLDGTDAAAFLFGRNAGAANSSHRIGRIEAAHRGTLVLEGVDELPLEHQASILRVLQDGRVTPLDSSVEIPIDVRVVSTTQTDLAECVAAGSFREDLLYRLDVIALNVPPLRDRPRDVVALGVHFLNRLAASAGEAPARLDDSARRALMEREFPGNVRELENLMRRAALLFPGESVEVAALDQPTRRRAAAPDAALRGFDLRALESETIARSLRATRGNRTVAARALGISVRTLRNKIQRYGLA